MIRVEIHSDPVAHRAGIKDGKAWAMRTQVGYVHLGRAYPTEFKFTLAEDQVPYAPGNYTLDARSIRVGDFDSLSFAREFVLIADKLPKAA